jgi:hypothetical protein
MEERIITPTTAAAIVPTPIGNPPRHGSGKPKFASGAKHEPVDTGAICVTGVPLPLVEAEPEGTAATENEIV